MGTRLREKMMEWNRKVGTRLREKMMKWSRKVETLTRVTKVWAVVAFVLIGLYILSILGIELVPGIIWMPIIMFVFIPLVLLALFKDLLVTVTKHGKSLFNQNKLIYVFLSNQRVVADILALIWAVTLLLPFKILETVCLIVMIAFPWKIAECFERKLKK